LVQKAAGKDWGLTVEGGSKKAIFNTRTVNVKKILGLILLVALACHVHAGGFYKWRDSNGVLHITDHPPDKAVVDQHPNGATDRHPNRASKSERFSLERPRLITCL
jgi:hypothetical protein